MSLALDKPAMVACYTSRLGCVAHDVASLRFWRVADAWLDGDANAALDRLREVDRTYPGERSSLWTTPLFYAYLGLGRFAEARQVTSRVSPAYHSFYEAIADARAGDAPAFDRVVGDLRDFDARDHFSFMLIWMRRLREADLLARERRAKVGSQPMPRDWIEFEGQLRQAQGRSREAVAILEPFARDAEYPRTAMHAVLAEAQWQSGDTQGALETLAFTDRRALAVMPAFGMYDWLKCRVLLVRIYRGLGGDRRAAEVEREVRQLLAASEPDNPLLLELDAIAQVHAMPAGDLPAAAAGARSSRARLNDRE